jgi:putative ABC transport system permease protein
MSSLRASWIRLRNLFRKERLEREFSEELASHLDLHVADNLRAGMNPEEARRAALLKLGGAEKTKEEYREQRGIPWMETLGQDLRFGIRILRKNPGFTMVAILALALGIGFSAVVFSLFYNGVLHPFPYRDAERLTVISIKDLSRPNWARSWFQLDEIAAMRKENHTFDDIVGYSGWDPVYAHDGVRETLHGCALTPNGMEFWGVHPLVGRGLTEQDAKAGVSPVALLSFGFWKREFNEDAATVGKSIVLNGETRTIIGVMPKRFGLFGADLYVPVAWDRPQPTMQGEASGEPDYFLATGIRKARVDDATASADLQPIVQRFVEMPERRYPQHFAISLSGIVDAIIGTDFRRTLWLLIGTVALLLFISSSNVASLLLVHTSARAREITLRSTLGASRGRLIRQLLLESVVLGVAGCAAGCLLAFAGLRLAMAFSGNLNLPGEADVSLNIPVLMFSVGVSFVTTVLFGLSPAFFAVGKDIRGKLQGSGVNASTIRGSARMRSVLVVGQVALSLLLLVFAGLMIRSFSAVAHFDYGMQMKNVLVAQVRFPAHQYESAESKKAYFSASLARIATIPGVTSAATAVGLPLQGGPGTLDITIPGKPHTDKWTTAFEPCSEDYFRTLGMQLLRGRLLSREDVAGARRVAVVNAKLVKKYFGSDDPIGRQIKFNELDDMPMMPHDAYFDIVGVVSDVRFYGFDEPAPPDAFIPYTFSGFGDRSLLVRTAVDPTLLTGSIRQAMADVDANPVLTQVTTMEEYLNGHALVKPRFRVISFSACAGIGLLLSMIGLFGVMAYSVALQTHALGVRMALGAQSGNILTLVLRQGLLLVGAGVALGLAAALLSARLLQSQLFGVSAFDSGTFVVAPLALLLIGLVACYLPARRATRVDPLIALRYE